MRNIFIVAAFVVLISGALAAQDPDYYVNTQDGFKVMFPSQPAVATTTWKSQQGYMLPARVYTVDRGREHYAVTVADYSNIENMAKEKVKTCPAGAPTCNGNDLTGVGYWKHDTRGAIINAVFRFTQRDAKLTDLLWSQHDNVEGYELQMTNNADQARTYAYITMHQMKLYIVEATVPRNNPPATLYQTSFTWVDRDGNGIRYATIYNNEFHGMMPNLYPVPAHAGAAAGAGRGAGAGRAGGAGRGN